MSALFILAGAGLCVSLKPDGQKIAVTPAERITPELANYIRRHKETIIAELKQQTDHAPPEIVGAWLTSGCKLPWLTVAELYQERAAIREHDGQHSRDVAESLALADVMAFISRPDTGPCYA
ncbi:hypothetical protein [Chitinilyticum litopenaei]|uniref:hypothetical protein n=1 Tax=Chitinilyticum litopenaei TaxID=1121276 RepID=UPI000407EBDE|nr:hypothetical protein [Chitinilyticum litopenaei]